MTAPKLSKLELYVKILEILERNSSLTLSDIKVKTGIKPLHLTASMQFLEQQNFVKPTRLKDNIKFENTPKAVRVLRYFGHQSELANNEMIS